MKLTTEQITKLVNELLTFESALQGREAELSELIIRVAEAKPEINFDELFRTRLRAEIMQLAKEQGGREIKSEVYKFNLNHMFNLKKISYGLAGAAVLILLIVPAVLILMKPGGKIALFPQAGKKIAFETKINKVAANAFGVLSSAVDGSTAPMLSARPQGGGGGAESASLGSANGVSGSLGLGGGVAADASAKIGIMPPFEGITYRYIYQGAELNALTEKMDVLKQVKGASVNVDMNNLVQGLNFGLSDVGSFSDLALQNISLVQRGENGYIISVMPEEGAISISQNWLTWPQAKCGNDPACFENQRVKPEDIPSDEELIGITDAFLAEHNIDKSVYGDPEVSPGYNFRIMYEASADKTNFYFPESIDVVYPVKIDGKYVYDEWNGIKQGLVVSVQAKLKKVSNLYNLTTQNYEASSYDMETDVKKILAYAEQGGVNVIRYDVETKTEDLALGDPELAYIKHYSYKDNVNSELLVPALYFPIKEQPKDGNFYRKGIIVPLAKSILEEREAQVVPYGLGGDMPAGSAGVMIKPPSAVDRPVPEPSLETKTIK